MQNHYELERQVETVISTYHRDSLRDAQIRSARSGLQRDGFALRLRVIIATTLIAAGTRLREEAACCRDGVLASTTSVRQPRTASCARA